ncbi:restriction endonuclease [Priestia megaterium]|uniref:hypothetical protein n=1 Tax=Priestia megaterium TaxID=1404 RepID=UPI002E23592D|nr:restriction endonuclease [Priestia megaterium]
MDSIDSSQYPKPREWNVKVFAMPRIPRSIKGYPESLSIILRAVSEKTPKNSIIQIPGSEAKNSLEELCIRLRPMGFVFQNRPGSAWELSKEASYWLETKDEMYLASFLNANIRFISELLNSLLNVHTTKELLMIANNEYLLGWEGKSQVSDRLQWLRDLGLVEFKEFLQKYEITGSGKQLLSITSPVNPNSLTVNIDETVNEEKVPVSNWALNLCELSQEELQDRKTSIGYVPGNSNQIYQTILGYLQLMQQPISKESIINYSKETYNVSEASINGFLSILTHAQLIEKESKTLYKTTLKGKKLVSDESEVNLICCLQNRFAFILEILKEIQQKELNAKELASISVVSYGYPSEKIDDIRKRLIFLKAAKLIKDCGKNSFSLTERGKKFIELIQPQQAKKRSNEADSNVNTKIVKQQKAELDTVLTEVRLASRDSANPDRFEKALVMAFSLLGFNATWLGGSGKTDVLLKTPTAPKFNYSITVDAKSTSNGAVTEGQLNFDTLLDHKKKHHADYSIVVGYQFQGRRLIERAEKHGVILFDIETLEQLIRRHIEVPLQFNAYTKLFSEAGIANLSLIEDDRKQMIRNSNLFQAILICLSEESLDPETQGMLLPRDIYQLLKKNKEFETSPSIKEIETMLSFLSSPFINCVGANKEEYFALGSLNDAAKKFEFYLQAAVNSGKTFLSIN